GRPRGHALSSAPSRGRRPRSALRGGAARFPPHRRMSTPAPGQAGRAASIQVRDLVVQYGSVVAVRGVSFSVGAGEDLTLLGPSGCGKPATLRAIAGVEKPTGGEIRIDGAVVYDGRSGAHVPSERRGLSMVFQSYAIWPHMSVFDNVAYGLRVRREPEREITRRVGEALELVQMGALA